MNYIRECNQFFDQLELNQLSSSSVSLWFILLQYHNKSGWKEKFSVPASALKLKAGLSEGSFQRARKELKEKGFLTYKSAGRNQAAVYQMISREALFSKSMAEQTNEKTEKQTSREVGYDLECQVEGHSEDLLEEQTVGYLEPLFKQEKSKKEEIKPLPTSTNACTFYEQNIGMLTPFIAEKIMKWCSDLSDELVIESMKLALQNNKRFFNYCEGVLKRWQSLGVKSPNDTKLIAFRPPQIKQKDDTHAVLASLRKERQS
ncbi:DnaD domain protein [Halobacillus salinarum]|uniref:DnaD domain protein n=1 Tax=Halobacillus salinarum TaxID=2932257 RepID=A0ABY4ENJ5_9BACI|nr:DnaD domain protein [Halobacillus salinarum]UOQ45408.1 DnaD domain protein [Halobacillus salinarum]